MALKKLFTKCGHVAIVPDRRTPCPVCAEQKKAK